MEVYGQMIRKVFFWLHLTAGCIAGLVILSMSVTGVLLAFERQINGWADAPAALQRTPTTSQVPLDALMGTLKSSGQGNATELVLHNDTKFPVEARFGRAKTLYLSPYTAEIVGQPSAATRTFFSTVERVHRSMGLGMQNAFGRGMTGAANLIFLFMLLSGLYLWLPRRFNIRSFRSRLLFRGGLQGKAREWNWHNVIGIWSLFPLLFIVASGVVMSYPWASNLLYTMTGNQPPVNGGRGDRPRQAETRVAQGHGEREIPAAEFRNLNELTNTVKLQAPDWKLMTIEMPDRNDPTLTVSVDTSIGGQPEKVTQYLIDRRSGAVGKVKRFSENNAGRKLRAWARFTHTGEEFGVMGEVIATLASIGAVLLVWTGMSMAIRRLLGRQPVQRSSIYGADLETQDDIREAMEV